MRIKTFCIAALIGSFLTASWAQGLDASSSNQSEPSSVQSIFEKMSDFQEMDLITNLDTLQYYKKEGRPQMAKLVLKGEGQEPFEIGLKIEARGKYRRRVCDFPPIKLDFSKKTLEKRGFTKKYDKIKLVTHCMENKDGVQSLLKEYWTYKLYNELTPASYRVHLIKINYIQEDQTQEPKESFAILIEDNDEMAHRVGGEIVEGMGKMPTDFTPKSYNNTLLFNFMIGNTDWNILFQKNIKMVKINGSEQLVLVPYDFDFSAFVKASYAHTNPDFPEQKKLEDRVGQGKFADAGQLHQLVEVFLDKEKSGFDQYLQCPNLSKGEKKRIERYLASFYEIVKDRQELENIFLAQVEK